MCFRYAVVVAPVVVLKVSNGRASTAGDAVNKTRGQTSKGVLDGFFWGQRIALPSKTPLLVCPLVIFTASPVAAKDPLVCLATKTPLPQYATSLKITFTVFLPMSTSRLFLWPCVRFAKQDSPVTFTFLDVAYAAE